MLASCAVESASPANATDDITGGRPALADPAVVALYFNHGDAYRGDLHCSGTLIAPRVVMTAAHCAPSPGDGTMHVGLERASGDGRTVEEFVRVVRVYVNEQFDPSNIERGYDIAFAELERPVTTVAPAAVRRTAMSSTDVGTPVRFVGYGYDETRAFGSKRQAMNRVASVTENKFTGGAGADTCQGDSGGPAFMTVAGVEVVAGVTSFGDPSCTGFGSYSRVDVFVHDVDRIAASVDRGERAEGPAQGPPQICESRATCLPGSGCTCETGERGAACCTDVTCAGGPSDPDNCSPRCRLCH